MDEYPRYNIGYLTALVSQGLSDQLKNRFQAAGFDLTQSQYSLLLDLYEQDGQSQQEIARKNWKDKAAVKRIVDILEQKGLLLRREKSHGRGHSLCLTPLAFSLENSFRCIGLQNLQDSCAQVDPHDMEVCLRVLRTIHQGLMNTQEHKQ